MTNIVKLFNYYNEHHKNKIFYTEMRIEGIDYAIMYTHDNEHEVQLFLDNFTKYFPYYVWNEDQLELLSKDEDLDRTLLEVSRKCWNNSSIVPKRSTKVNGIYGEVYLDFYERIVKGNRIFITFAGKRSFSSNFESTGFDNVLFNIEQDSIELIFSEAKFVGNVSSACSSIIEDINGVKDVDKRKSRLGHLTKEFFNKYISFTIQKKSLFSEEDRFLIEPFITELNNVLVNQGEDFLQYLINKNIKIICVFFAIFESNSFSPIDFKTNYEEINQSAVKSLNYMGLSNYCIEIVFIPTKSKVMDIKEAINEFYK